LKYLLDTNACIQLLRRGQGDAVRRRIAPLAVDDVALCAPVRYELFFGAHRSDRREENLAKVRVLLAQFASLPFDDAAAERAAEIRAHLTGRGTPIGPADLLIAAIAVSKNLTLVTNNTAEFGRVPSLKIEDWQNG
jgi:tRNA(fMet)-specific endonuclease VapC